MIIEKSVCEIYTDASFHDTIKIATYGIVIVKNNKIIKAFSKKCKVKLENSTESEIYAMFQAMIIVESNLINNQKITIRTDCIEAKKILEGTKSKIFKRNIDLYNQIQETYKRILNKTNAKNKNFTLQWIPRKKNKMAHKLAYAALKKVKVNENNILMTEKEMLLKVLKRSNSKKCKVLIYLYLIANENKLINKKQEEISNSLGISTSSICKIYKELNSLNILKKIHNGKYLLLV